MIIKLLAFNKFNKTHKYYYEQASPGSTRMKNYHENLCLIKNLSLPLGHHWGS